MIKKHMLMKMSGVRVKDALLYSNVLEKKIENVLEELEMNIVGRSMYQFQPYGATVLFLLSESHCSAHTFWEEGEVYIDLFCCRDFDIEKALKIFCDALEPTEVHFEMVDR